MVINSSNVWRCCTKTEMTFLTCTCKIYAAAVLLYFAHIYICSFWIVSVFLMKVHLNFDHLFVGILLVLIPLLDGDLFQYEGEISFEMRFFLRSSKSKIYGGILDDDYFHRRRCMQILKELFFVRFAMNEPKERHYQQLQWRKSADSLLIVLNYKNVHKLWAL